MLTVTGAFTRDRHFFCCLPTIVTIDTIVAIWFLSLQAGFLVVAGTGALVLAAGDVEVVGHGHADDAVIVVAIYALFLKSSRIVCVGTVLRTTNAALAKFLCISYL